MDALRDMLLAPLLTLLASSGFWTYIHLRDKAKNATTRLLMGLAYDKLMSVGVSYIERGWITKDEYEDYRKYLFEPYKALGGNGVAERIMDEVTKLPLRRYDRYTQIIKSQNITEVTHDQSSAA